MADPCNVRIEADGDDTLLWIKVVPAASRDQITGALGNRLKVRVTAPPESGKANKAVCALLEKALGVRRGEVSIEHGRSNPDKTVRVHGVGVHELRQSIC